MTEIYLFYPVTMHPTSSKRRLIVEFQHYTFRHNQTHTHSHSLTKLDIHTSIKTAGHSHLDTDLDKISYEKAIGT